MAYSAAISVESLISSLLNYCGVILPPNCLKMFEFAAKELNSLATLVERLDSRSRQRMKLCLAMTAACVGNLGREVSYDKVLFTDDKEFEESKTCRDIRVLIEIVKQMKEECYEDEGGSSSSSVSNMVGLREQRSTLKRNLVNQRMTNVPVVVLAGMAGVGKTTLAGEMFRDLDVLESFDCCVWATVGHECKSEEVTRAILAQLDPDSDAIVYEEEVGRLRLKQSLESKKYLFVLDDVSFDNVLDYLRSSLPDKRDGSRVLVTTRKKTIDYHHLSYACLIELRLMNEEESWDLLRDKVFGSEWFPPQLEKHGKMIAKRCDALPLTIVTVADLLSKANDTRESFWHK